MAVLLTAFQHRRQVLLQTVLLAVLGLVLTAGGVGVVLASIGHHTPSTYQASRLRGSSALSIHILPSDDLHTPFVITPHRPHGRVHYVAARSHNTVTKGISEGVLPTLTFVALSICIAGGLLLRRLAAPAPFLAPPPATTWSACGGVGFQPRPKAKPKAPGKGGDMAALLNRSTKVHAELLRRHRAGTLGEGLRLKEWVVSVRVKPGTQEVPGLCVWTPVCSLVAMGKVDAVQNVKPAQLVAGMYREITQSVTQISVPMQAVGRTTLEYAVEDRQSWDENVADKKRYSKSDDSYKALGLGPDADRPAIQAAYRRLSVELRPENYPKDPEKQQECRARMQKVQDAYNVLAVYKNGLYYWYSAIEGNGRPGFSGLLDLSDLPFGSPIPGIELPIEAGGVQVAAAQLVHPVVTDIVRFNVLRHNEGIATVNPTPAG